MKRRTIRLFIILSVISLSGVIVVQYYWFTKAFNIAESDFTFNVSTALQNVSQRILKFNKSQPSGLQVVEKQASNYYTVMVNDLISPDLLEAFLSQELIKQNIDLDFEYAIYDCNSNAMQYGDYVCLTGDCYTAKDKKYSFPKLKDDNYYFGIYFPKKDRYIASGMDIWLFSSVVILIVVMFFAYAIFVILRQKRLSEIQSDFVNNMTHEFKTPISTIAISSEVLMKEEIVNEPKRLLSYATIINKEINRLKQQVERTLQMVKPQKPDLLSLEKVDLHLLINGLLENRAAVFNDKDIDISFIPQAKKNIIKADSLHLSNVLYNLLDNSAKYCNRKPEIKISTYSNTSEISVIIEDNGLGVSEKYQKNIFEKFYRVPSGDVHDVKGFGLGLYYVMMIVKAHQGRISLESKIDEGSIFTLVFPLIKE